MTLRDPGARIPPLTFVLLLVFAATSGAGDFTSQSNFGSTFFNASPPCPAKRIPTFEALTPVPGIIDPFEQDLIPMFCDVQVTSEGKGVKGVEGKYTSELVVRDNATGDLETFPVGSGAFRTNRDGRATFDFDLPADLFADGFESGDVSAGSYTRTDFTNRKRAGSASTSCATGTSRSSN